MNEPYESIKINVIEDKNLSAEENWWFGGRKGGDVSILLFSQQIKIWD